MTLNELQNLDPQRIGSWPLPVRAVVILLVCAAVLGAGYWFDTQNQIAALDQSRSKETQLKSTFEAKARKAANLEPLKRQLAEMKQTFGDLLRLLPNKTEIAGLLVDISQAGLAAGLEFELFKPEAEQPAEFYAIQPIQIRVTGTYHQLGHYISAVAALPRIVTQHDIVIVPRPGPRSPAAAKKAAAQPNPEPRLVMSLTAKTYRYLEENEIQAASKGKKK